MKPMDAVEMELIRIIRLEYRRRFFMGICCGGNVYAAISTLRKYRKAIK